MRVSVADDVEPTLSVTVSATFRTPGTAWLTPPRTPPADIVRPSGSPLAAQVYGTRPPVAVIVAPA